jgi:DNA invertase Pin-like site-specific DNA recombinase
LGVSAFRGTNVESGALGRFLQAVESGQIPAGSALVVEGLDRLSRQDPWKTISLLKQLKDSGIEIHFTMADMVLSPDDSDDGMKLMFSVTTAIRAHDESKTKSRRLIEAFAAKRAKAAAGGTLVSKSLPWWLEFRDGRIIAPPERAKIVKRAFKMTTQGLSSSEISRAFNKEQIPTWKPRAKQWSASRIRDLIRGSAVLGTLAQTPKTTKAGRSHPEIKGYYPAIVSDGLAAEARAAMIGNKVGVAGRRASGDKPLNIFRGLLRHKGRWMRYQPHRNGEVDQKRA